MTCPQFAETVWIILALFNRGEILEEEPDEPDFQEIKYLTYQGATRVGRLADRSMKAARSFRGTVPKVKLRDADWTMIHDSRGQRIRELGKYYGKIQERTPPTNIRYMTRSSCIKWVETYASRYGINLDDLLDFWEKRSANGRDCYENPEALVASYQMIGGSI